MEVLSNQRRGRGLNLEVIEMGNASLEGQRELSLSSSPLLSRSSQPRPCPRFAFLDSYMFGLPSLLALVLLSPLAILAQSSNPTLVYPIDQQLPPVAHVGSAFNFSLIQGTFASTSSNPLTYSVTDLPKWAVFNNESLLFAGVPSGFDEGRSRVKVTASDGSE